MAAVPRLFLLLLGLALALPAAARDASTIAILGFSPDGRFFAFEEYGREAGTNAAFANVFVIESARDEWVRGTPFRARLDRPGSTVEAARAEVARRSGDMLASLAIREPGDILAQSDSPDPAAAVRVVAAVLPGTGPAEIRLADRPASAAAHCPGGVRDVAGYDLSIIAGGRRVPLAQSLDIPRSRGCPSGYGISKVLLHESAGRRVLAVVLSVYGPRAEGQRRRFLTLTRVLP